MTRREFLIGVAVLVAALMFVPTWVDAQSSCCCDPTTPTTVAPTTTTTTPGGPAQNTYATTTRAMLGVLELSTTTDHDVLAMAARAQVALGDDPTATLDRLWSLRYPDNGFGLDKAWDAFQDGTTNPADTTYAYVTIEAAIAFQEGGQVNRANTIADLVVNDLFDGTDVDYSTTSTDRPYTVWNIDGLGLDLLQRLDRDPAVQAALVARLNAGQGTGGATASWQWRYLVDGGQPSNDATHFAFIAFPLEVAGHTSAADNGYRAFTLPGGKTRDFHTSSTATVAGWGPGWNLAMLTRRPANADLAVQVANDLVASVSAGWSSYATNPDGWSPGWSLQPRYQAHLAWGLAVYAGSL